MKKHILFLSVLSVLLSMPSKAQSQLQSQSQSQSPIRGTYSFTQPIFGDENITKLTFYLVFVNNSEVLLCANTPDNYIIPLGVGAYNTTTKAVVFRADTPTHKKIAIYYGGKDIVLKIKATGNDLQVEGLDAIFDNDGVVDNVATFSKENIKLVPSTNLVGSNWRASHGGESYILTFLSKYEALLNGEKILYVSWGNCVSIISGDNPYKEVISAKYTTSSNSLYFHRHGLGRVYKDINVEFRKVE